MKRNLLRAALLLALVGPAIAQTESKSPSNADGKKPSAPPKVQIVKGPVVEHVSDREAVIAWSTNVSSGSTVRYSAENPENLTERSEMPWGGMTHRVRLKNLKPGQKYYFMVASENAQGTGTSVKSEVQTFTTLPAKNPEAARNGQ